MIRNALSTTDFDQIYLAFDIHDVLAEEKANEVAAPIFQEYGMLLRVPVEGYSKPIRHYVYPFVKELFQLLTETPGVHIAFATSSKEAFAKPFVEQLLINALGQEKYTKIAADKVLISAKEQLRNNDSYNEVPHSRFSTFGNNRKDLDDVYPHSNIPKRQRLLIDDCSSFAAPHQIKNHFNVSGTRWTEKLERYQRFGLGLHFYPSKENFEKIQNSIESEESIALYAKQAKDKENVWPVFVIVYYNREGKKELELSSEESIKIKELYEKSVLESITCISASYYSNNDQKAIIDEIEKISLEKPLDPEKSWLIFVCGEGVSPKECAEKASSGNIVILLGENDANLYFPQNPEKTISLTNNGSLKLIKLAREYWATKCKNLTYFTKERDIKTAKAQLYETIWDKVKDLVWKEKIIHQANHILLLTGAIF